MSSAPLARILDDLLQGRMIILTDEEGRENEGDLVLAAERVTPEALNFMLTHARGFICLPVADDLAERLGLHPMVKDNECPLKTPFTVTIDARAGITTGVSVQDRTVTIRRVVADDARPEDFVRPGHVFPLRAHPRGLLARTGHTEGSVALVALAGMKPAAVISEIMNPDGSMARRPDLDAFARSHRIPICTTSSVLHLLRNTPSVPGR